MKKIIWTNKIDLKDYKDFIGEEYEEDDLTDNEKWQIANDLNGDSLEYERCDLDIQLDGRILVVAKLGLWDGQRIGFRIINSGNIKDILYTNDDFIEWFSDGYNIKGIGNHHDGTNYYEYREIREDRNVDNLLDKIYSNKEFSRITLNYYTKSILPKVNEVYGW